MRLPWWMVTCHCWCWDSGAAKEETSRLLWASPGQEQRAGRLYAPRILADGGWWPRCGADIHTDPPDSSFIPSCQPRTARGACSHRLTAEGLAPHFNIAALNLISCSEGGRDLGFCPGLFKVRNGHKLVIIRYGVFRWSEWNLIVRVYIVYLVFFLSFWFFSSCFHHQHHRHRTK